MGRVGLRPERVFLDANILFSAAVGGPAFDLMWELMASGRVVAVSSARCVAEARVNLERKRARAVEKLDSRLELVTLVPEARRHAGWAERLVGSGDAHVLAAARAAQVDCVVTGDVRDFGSLMEREDLPFRVRTPRAFLLEGPA